MRSARHALFAATAIALVGTPLSQAAAVDIVLRPDDSFNNAPGGVQALYAFRKAANYWNQTLSGSNQTININVSYRALAPNVIGSTGSSSYYIGAVDFIDALGLTGVGNLDSTAFGVLQNRLTANGGIGFRRPSPLLANGNGLNTNVSVFDNNDSDNNLYLEVNSANLKGIGFNLGPYVTDASITFSSAFSFDFDPTDGIGVGQQDFVAVATHELGHALGFVSGVDLYDFYGASNGPCATTCVIGGRTFAPGTAYNWDDIPVLTSLDLFRASTAAFQEPGLRALQLDPNRPAAFSYDGNSFFNGGNGNVSSFSTGQYNGDGAQASHWKDANGYFDENGCFVTDTQLGIMDPTSGSCQPGVVTANDLAAFDAIGYNLGFDVTRNKGYTFSTSQIFGLSGLAGVPEPSTWALMIAGFGFVGGAMRRRRVTTRVVIQR